jgi:hypothetical protein
MKEMWAAKYLKIIQKKERKGKSGWKKKRART